MKVTMQEALAVTALAKRIFSELAPVIGYGVTKIGQSYGVKINLREPPSPGVALPAEVNGVPVRVQVVGQVLSLGHPEVKAPTSRKGKKRGT